MQSKVDLYQDNGTVRGSKEESKDGVFPYLSRRSSESRGRDSS